MSSGSPPPLGKDHKAYVKSLDRTDDYLAWKAFTDTFWNSPSLNAGEKAEFLFRRGFLRDKWVLYDFQNSTPELYLSDLQAEQVSQANGIYASVLQDKMLLCHTLSEYCRTPSLYALRGLGAEEVSLSSEWEAHREHSVDAPPLDVTVQPLFASARGRSETIKVRRGGFEGFGKSGSLERLSKIVRDWSKASSLPYLFSETLHHSTAMDELTGGYTSRLSVILVRDLRNWDPVLISATLLLGTARSEGRLELAQGALSVPVDVETGMLGPAAELTESGILRRHEKHPETDAAISNLVINAWDKVRQTLLRIMDESSYMRVGFLDFSLLEDGQIGLIGPSQNGVGIVQVHGSLLDHPTFAETIRNLIV